MSVSLALSLQRAPIATAAPGTARSPAGSAPLSAAPAVSWPAGAQVLAAEDLDGVLLLHAALRGATGRDTSGALVLDTGSGYLALDRHLGVALGLTDSLAGPGTLALAQHPLARLALGDAQMDQVAPVLIVDTEVVHRVTDRDVLGLLGQRPLAPYVVWIDYQGGTLALLPAGAARPGESALAASRRAIPALTARARAVPFRLGGDGKILVSARFTDAAGGGSSARLTLALDTGATKTVFFATALERLVPASAAWPSLRGLSAPTLLGSEEARLVRVPRLELDGPGGATSVRDMDAAVMESDLEDALARASGESIRGLLGYSFLRRFHVGVDFPRSLLWLDPVDVTRDARRYEYSHVGLQVERVSGVLRVVAVARGTPADRAGVVAGDEVVSVDGEDASALGVIEAARRLEGPPGSRVTLGLRHAGAVRTITLVRRRLL